MVADLVQQGTLTAEGLLRAVDVLDGQERLEVGGLVVSLGFTNAAVKDLSPREWDDLAGYLQGLLQREPIKSGRAYAGHRILLGTLATELRGFAVAAGWPTDGGATDLRAPDVRQAEIRAAQLSEALNKHVDDVIASHQAQRTWRSGVDPGDDYVPDDDHTDLEDEDMPAAVTTAPTTPTDDPAAYL